MKLLLENWRKFLNEEDIIPADINKKILAVFDFDETIADTHAQTVVRIRKTGEPVRRLSQAQLDTEKPGEGEEFDFSEFDDVGDAEEKKNITNRMKKFIDHPNSQVMVVTARESIAEDPIHSYLDFLNIDTDNLIIKGLAGESKGDYLSNIVGKNPSIERVFFFDDSEKNVQDVWVKLNNLKKDTGRELFINASHVLTEGGLI